jgi:branched-chain amino acid transport system permease protein
MTALRPELLFPVLAAALVAVGVILPAWLGFILAISLAKGLVVLGLVLLMRAGLVSFGQGLYYCLGGYAAGLLWHVWGISDVVVVLLAAVAMALAVAFAVGQILCRYRQIFFAMFTMAFSMILYGILVRSQQLGSTDGFNVGKPSILGWSPPIGDATLFVLALLCLLFALLGYAVHRFIRSSSGYATEAVRENEIRVEYLGVSAFRVIRANYLIAAVLAAVGGAMTAFVTGHVDPAMAYWTTSGEFVFIALLAGRGNVVAAFLAAIVFELLRSYAVAVAPYTWQMILGVALLALILFLPEGLSSLMGRFRREGRA